jgi:hypothetical protein
MAIEYTNFYHSKALENVPKFGFLVRKHTIWQPWPKYWPNLPTRPWNPGGSSKKRPERSRESTLPLLDSRREPGILSLKSISSKNGKK